MSHQPLLRSALLTLIAMTALTGRLSAQTPAAPRLAAQSSAAPEVLFRLDDIGVNHSVNMAIEQIAATKMPFSVSVLFACPWYQEAVEILKKNPQITVGVHLALNSEWRGYRWGPVLGKAGVPSLVDSLGYFRPSVKDFTESKYDLGEVERELSAQVDRAVASGLKITYVDGHMGTAFQTPELRAVVERVAKKYGLAISRGFGESSWEAWGIAPASKKDSLLAHLRNARRDSINLTVMHVFARTPESEAMWDMNAASQNVGSGVAAHRSAELDAMLSPELAQLVSSGKIRLVTYSDLVARQAPRSTPLP
jgi:predicted glycoside hydrolase/deacetylase ChbG (UPF0249 family)